jgi:hypothetical protein
VFSSCNIVTVGTLSQFRRHPGTLLDRNDANLANMKTQVWVICQENLQYMHLTLNNSKILTQSVRIPTLCDVTHKAGFFVTVANRVYFRPFPSVTVSSCLGKLI